MSVIGFILTVIGTFACTGLVLSCIWASEDRRADHEEDDDGKDTRKNMISARRNFRHL